MKVTELLLEAETFKITDIIKKHGLKKTYSYGEGSGVWEKWTEKGQKIYELFIDNRYDDNERKIKIYNVDVDLPKKQKKSFKGPKALEELSKFLDGIDLSAISSNAMPDDKIVKWIGQQLIVRLSLKDLKGCGYIVWGPKVVQLVEGGNLGQFPWVLFREGSKESDDYAALGQIKMTAKDFIEWLEKHGVTKRQKPKRSSSSSYYD